MVLTSATQDYSLRSVRRAFSLRLVSEPTCAMPAALRLPLLPPPLTERLVLEVPTDAFASPVQ